MNWIQLDGTGITYCDPVSRSVRQRAKLNARQLSLVGSIGRNTVICVRFVRAVILGKVKIKIRVPLILKTHSQDLQSHGHDLENSRS